MQAQQSRRFREVQVDMSDENEVFSFLSMVVQDTPAQPYFLSILQHLLLVRDDEIVRSGAWMLLHLLTQHQHAVLPARRGVRVADCAAQERA